MKKSRKYDDQWDRDYDDYLLTTAEDELVEHVKWYWAKTRQGPHDDCDCYWFYRQELKHAIKRLRAFRQGVYWA